jgi:hypothetical protein
MIFHINYWRNPSGKAPVEKYIDEIDNKEERAELLSVVKEIQTAKQRLKQLMEVKQ